MPKRCLSDRRLEPLNTGAIRRAASCTLEPAAIDIAPNRLPDQACSEHASNDPWNRDHAHDERVAYDLPSADALHEQDGSAHQQQDDVPGEGDFGLETGVRGASCQSPPSTS